MQCDGFLRREGWAGRTPISLSESLCPKWPAQRTHVLTFKRAKKRAIENKMLKVGSTYEYRSVGAFRTDHY